MSLIKWSDEYLIKIPELDKEHKILSEMINSLHESMLNGKDSKVVSKTAKKLLSYAEKHFESEEKHMRNDDFSDAVSHKLSHNKLLRQLKELIKDICSANKRDISKTALLGDWFVHHLLMQDKKYGFYTESEERYKLILEGVNVVGWEYDPFRECFTFVSGKAKGITGYAPQKWYEKGFWVSTIHPEDREFAIQCCKNATERGEDYEFEYRMIVADGSFVWFRYIVHVVFNNGKVTGLRGILIDVTEKKKAEELLKSSSNYLQKLNDSIRDVIFTVKFPERTIEYANCSVRRVFGYKPDEYVGKKTKMFYSNAEEYYDFGRLLKNGMKEGKNELRVKKLLKRKNGEIFPCEITSTFLKENEKVVRIISILRDISERKEAEKRLLKQKKALEKKNIALSEVISQIQHEKQQVKEDVSANVENLLLPVIQKIKLKGESRKYVKLLQKNLQELTSSFSTKLTEKKAKLTSREIEICNMVKNGSTSKEIAGLLSISIRTTEKHRSNIRKKLGIINEDFNLASFLKTL